MFFRRPINIDTEAAAILNSACRSASHILWHRQRLDQQHDARPLMVFLGDQHSNPAHQLDTIAIMHQLTKASASFVAALEQPHDAMAKVLRDAPEVRFLFENLNEEKKQIVTLQLMNSHGVTKWAKYANIALNDFIVAQDIKSCLADCSATADKYLNSSDPSTARSIQDCLKTIVDDESVISRKGVYIRNDHMLRLTTEFAACHKAGIALILCGDAHVAGSKNDPHEESLASLAAKRRLPFDAIPRICTNFTKDDIELNQVLSADNLMVVDGLPLHEAIYGQKKWSLAGLTSRFNSAAKEEAYVNACLDRMDIAYPRLSAKVAESLKIS